MTFVHGEQTSGIKTGMLGTSTRNLEIQDGEDVDVVRRPDRLDRYLRVNLKKVANSENTSLVDLFETWLTYEDLCHLIEQLSTDVSKIPITIQ